MLPSNGPKNLFPKLSTAIFVTMGGPYRSSVSTAIDCIYRYIVQQYSIFIVSCVYCILENFDKRKLMNMVNLSQIGKLRKQYKATLILF